MKQLIEQLGFKDENGVYLPMLSEFVKEIGSTERDGWLFAKCNNYTDFITQPLTKGMFIPCDEDGNALEENLLFPANLEGSRKAEEYRKQYQQAKERVLFEGWELKHNGSLFVSNGKQKAYFDETIEQAINNGVKLYLK